MTKPSSKRASSSEAHRFARHLVLAEVGPEGQANINALRIDVPPGRCGAVAGEYLKRAGATIEPGSTVIPAPTNEASKRLTTDDLRIAIDTIHGAFSALEALRRGLGMDPHEPLCLDDEPTR